ncbi:MAG TPA: toll/interleukin-1 receptor domain-containing protein, partial [Prosthecobacter sp.]|nr:toll/interleukin-1 receptor domain-containing protein [Prosthecobacter sp.]
MGWQDMPLQEASERSDFTYYAFISYSRKDSKEAKWLQKRLEWFRYPVKLVKEQARPLHRQYVRPIYRDKTNLEVDKESYWTNIRLAIEASRFLIVVCSPDSARSNAVEQEVRHFLSTRKGGIDMLVPVILRGTVGTGDVDECLCPALAELGTAITSRNLPTMTPDERGLVSEGWEDGFIAVVAYLLGLRRQELGDHVRREARRKVMQARALA